MRPLLVQVRELSLQLVLKMSVFCFILFGFHIGDFSLKLRLKLRLFGRCRPRLTWRRHIMKIIPHKATTLSCRISAFIQCLFQNGRSELSVVWYRISSWHLIHGEKNVKKCSLEIILLLHFMYVKMIMNGCFIITSSFDSLHSFTSRSLLSCEERYAAILYSFLQKWLHSTFFSFAVRDFFFLGIKHQSAFQCFSFHLTWFRA